jgi:hypothetical protein
MGSPAGFSHSEAAQGAGLCSPFSNWLEIPMSKKVAEVVVATLQAAGVKHCYGIVGDTLNTSATRQRCRCVRNDRR